MQSRGGPGTVSRSCSLFGASRRARGYNTIEFRYALHPDGICMKIGQALKEILTPTMHDTSTLQARERALRDSDEELRIFIQQAPASIAMFDREMRYLAASNRWRQDYKIPENINIIGRSHYEIFPEIPERWKEMHRRGLGGESLSADEDPFERADGSTQWVKWELHPWFDTDGRVGGLFIAAEEVTERVLAKKALQESRSDLNRAQAVGQIGSWRLDTARNVLSGSDEYYRILGLPKGKPLTYEALLMFVHPEDREPVKRMWNAALGGEPFNSEHRLIVHGKVKWVREEAYLESDEADDVLGAFGITQDITSRKHAELALQEADRHKDEFLALLAHELRNPLAAIFNAAQVLRVIGTKEAALDRASSIIDRQVHQLAHLVDDLLDISRISSGKIKLKEETFDLSEVIGQAVEVNQHFIDAREQRLNVTLPSKAVRVKGDYTRLAQVVSNLINNAAKYTGNGGTISVTVEQGNGSAGDRSHVLIRVRDNGRGIEPTSLTSLFDMFYQACGNGDPCEGGLGLGLSLVKSLVEMHGGWVKAHSAGLGAGSEFTVCLPCLPQDPQISRDDRASSLHTVGCHRILLVEDNIDVADSMVLLLKIYGQEVTVARDGREAVELALRERPDVILMDIGLPYVDGIEACRAIRSEGLIETVIVAVTGYGQETDRKKAETAGFDRHMTKPLKPQDLMTFLDSLPPAD